MGMRGRKRKARRKKAANHGKRPNARVALTDVATRRSTVAASATSHRSTSCMNPVGDDMNIARRVFLCRKSLGFMIIGCPWRTGVLREV